VTEERMHLAEKAVPEAVHLSIKAGDITSMRSSPWRQLH
jgi:tRNA threonylcarbamoyladenosine modification (KEOPS) complex  Pcc1 subunit